MINLYNDTVLVHKFKPRAIRDKVRRGSFLLSFALVPSSRRAADGFARIHSLSTLAVMLARIEPRLADDAVYKSDKPRRGRGIIMGLGKPVAAVRRGAVSRCSVAAHSRRIQRAKAS